MSSLNRLGVNRPSNAEPGGVNGPMSQGSTILDTLKKKMSQLKEELEVSREELDKNRILLEEEKKRRECVSFESDVADVCHATLRLLSIQSLRFFIFNILFSLGRVGNVRFAATCPIIGRRFGKDR